MMFPGWGCGGPPWRWRDWLDFIFEWGLMLGGLLFFAATLLFVLERCAR